MPSQSGGYVLATSIGSVSLTQVATSAGTPPDISSTNRTITRLD
ncbi:hypothetical protein [Cellulosimicrobium sp. RS]